MNWNDANKSTQQMDRDRKTRLTLFALIRILTD